MHSIASRTAARAVVSIIAIASIGAARQESVQLVRKVKVGDVSRMSTVGKALVDVNGMQMHMDLKGTDTYTVTAVAPNGDITETDKPDSVEISMEGQAMPPDPEMLEKSTIVTKPNGMLVSYVKEDGTVDTDEGRMHNAATVIFADTPVKVGDKWSKTFAANSAIGTHTARADYEVLGFETIAGTATVKIALAFQESVAPAIKTRATFWIERATGGVVKLEGTIDNFPLDEASGVTASLTITQTRLPKGQ